MRKYNVTIFGAEPDKKKITKIEKYNSLEK